MSMRYILQYITVPTACLEAIRFDDIVLVINESDEPSYSLVDFGNRSGEDFESPNGNYILLSSWIDKERIDRENLMGWQKSINDQFYEFAEMFLPSLAKHLGVNIKESNIDATVDAINDLFVPNLAWLLAGKLHGIQGTMHLKTIEGGTGLLYYGNHVLLPSHKVETNEDIDLKTGRLLKVFKSFEVEKERDLEFKGFDLFWSYFSEPNDTLCEVRIDTQHGSYLFSCRLEDSKTLDGELTVVEVGKEIWRGESNEGFSEEINRLIKSPPAIRREAQTEALMKLNPYQPPEEDIDKLWVLIGRGDFDGALKVISKLGEKFVYSHKFWIAKGAANEGAGNLEAAEMCFTKATGLSPNSSGQFNLGVFYLKQERYEEALVAFRLASCLDPYNKRVINNIKLLENALGLNMSYKSGLSFED